MVRNIAKPFPVNRLIALAAAFLCCLALMPGWLHAQEHFDWKAESIAMSPDGKYLAVKYGVYDEDKDRGDFDSGVWIYNLDDLLTSPHYLIDASYYGTYMTFSPDSRQVSVSSGGGLKIFNSDDGLPILTISNSSIEIPTNFGMLSYSTDSGYVVSHSYRWRHDDGVMSIWDIETGRLVSSTPAPRTSQWTRYPWLSPDWRNFLDWSGYAQVKIYDFDTEQGLGRHLRTIIGEERGVVFSQDGLLFALVTTEHEILIYRTDTWELDYIQALGDHSCGNADVTMAFGHSKPWLVFWCNWDGRLLVWDMENGEVLLQTKGPSGRFRFLSQNDEMLVAAELGYSPENSEITVWDANTGFQMSLYPGKNPQIHPNAELMASIGPDGRVWIWNLKSKELLEVLPMPQRQSF